MIFYNPGVPVTYSPIRDAAFFGQATNFDVFVRDANGNIVYNADGTPQTTKGDLRDLLVPMAGDRARLLAQAATNQRRFVEEHNDWVGNLTRAFQEMERHKPTGTNSRKTPRVNVEGQDFNPNFSISADTANTLLALKDQGGASLLSKYFVFSPAPGAGGFSGSVVIDKMANKQTWSTFDNAFKSAVDQATQKAQLEQTSLQGLVSRQNNAIETMADLQQKFTGTMDKLVGNLRPAR
jgi:hypothetical protein